MTPEEIVTYVDAASMALRLPLDPTHRPGVLRYFALAASMADWVEAHPLSTEDEPAAAFVPIAPAADAGTAA